MARIKSSFLLTGIVLAAIFLSDFLNAGPLGPHEKDEASKVAEEKPESSSLEKLTRNRRNILYYQRLPEFWSWYKYYTDTNNQEGVENLDQLYRIYLQNKHRVEDGRSYNHYLTHLSEIYRSCANSDDPDCIAEYTSKPKAKIVMPAPLKHGLVQMCNPYLNPYCLYGISPAAPEEPSRAPAPVKSAAPALSPLLPMALKAPLGYYYSPVMEPFLSTEQRSELLRICNPSDVECLQYHLRAAYGYRPALGPLPSYAHLGCDPSKDPLCQPTLVAKGPSGFYHLYPTCDPTIDPLCVTNVAPASQRAENAQEAPREQYCNPLFDTGCSPLTATKLASLTKPVLEYMAQDEPTPHNLACDPRYDPYCLMGGTAALMKPPPQLPQFQSRSRLGVRGKTKDGHNCYVFYDKDCTPLASQDLKVGALSTKLDCHPYDPSCSRLVHLASTGAQTGSDGFIEPHPDCDPEIDFNCRLRHAKPVPEEHKDQPAQQESGPRDPSTINVAPKYPVPTFEDFMRGYMDQYKK